MNTCPICSLQAEVVEIAVHLMDQHDWDYGKAQAWIRDNEETQSGQPLPL